MGGQDLGSRNVCAPHVRIRRVWVRSYRRSTLRRGAMAEIRDVTEYLAKDALSRRKFLQATGLVAASLAAGPLLEACGGGGNTGTTGTGTYVPPKAKAGAKVQLLQWN